MGSVGLRRGLFCGDDGERKGKVAAIIGSFRVVEEVTTRLCEFVTLYVEFVVQVLVESL